MAKRKPTDEEKAEFLRLAAKNDAGGEWTDEEIAWILRMRDEGLLTLERVTVQ